MKASEKCLFTGVAGFILFTGPGCVVIVGCGPRVWQESTEELRIESAGLAELEVRSHNGKVGYTGEDGTAAVVVSATKRGGGRTLEGADEALAAIEVYVESVGEGTQRLGWRWKERKQMNWEGSVAFSITGPEKLDLDVETHNGQIVVGAVAGSVAVVTHNGAVSVRSDGPKLHAESHNGAIAATFTGGDVELTTHNGEIDAKLLHAGPLGGAIATHNGSINVAVADGAASDLQCTTHNGRIKLDVANETTMDSKRFVKASIGEGGPPLTISTHNGSIKVRASRG